jgi:hypothetical protein
MELVLQKYIYVASNQITPFREKRHFNASIFFLVEN